jgi:hypothetical protein
MCLLPPISDTLFLYKGCLIGDESLYTYPDYDLEFEYWKLEKVKAVASVYREMYKIDAYVGLASNIHISLDDWLDHDVIWQETLVQAVGSLVDARNKASQEQTDKILKASQEGKEQTSYVSPFASSGMRPQFQMS